MQIKKLFIFLFIFSIFTIPIFADEPCDPNCPPGSNYSLGVIKTDLDTMNKTIDVFFYIENFINRTPINNTRLYVNYVVNDSVKTCYIITDGNGSTTFAIPTNETNCSTYVFAYCLNTTTLDEIKTCLGTNVSLYPSLCAGSNVYVDLERPLIYAAPADSRYCIPKRFDLEMSFCMPIMLIMGLLAGALFLSGVNPLNYFDLSGAPRFPKQQPYRLRKGSFFLSVGGLLSSTLKIKSSGKTLLGKGAAAKKQRKSMLKQEMAIVATGMVAKGLSAAGVEKIGNLKLEKAKENFVNTVKLVNTMKGRSSSRDKKETVGEGMMPEQQTSSTSLFTGWEQSVGILKGTGINPKTTRGKLIGAVASLGMSIWVNPYISAFIPLSIFSKIVKFIYDPEKRAYKKIKKMYENGDIDENSMIEIGEIDSRDPNDVKVEVIITNSKGKKRKIKISLNGLSLFARDLSIEADILENGPDKEQRSILAGKFSLAVGEIRQNIIFKDITSRRGEDLFPNLGKLKVNSLDKIIAEVSEIDLKISDIDIKLNQTIEKNEKITLIKRRGLLLMDRNEIVNATVARITNPNSKNPIAPSISQGSIIDMINTLVELTNEQPENMQSELRTAAAFKQYEEEMLSEDSLRRGLAILLTSAFLTRANTTIIRSIDMQNNLYIEEYRNKIEETKEKIKKLEEELE